ncbi:MAG: peptide deformylase [Ignavibacteriaceae bacterium]|nr:peptide deformylase [Ignavibacteriaceae bacterium]
MYGEMMALLPITLIGDKILRRKVKKVTEVDVETVDLIKNMFSTMRNANGIGLAANQVGADKAIIVIDVSVVDEYKNVKPMVLINPNIIFRSEEKIVMEEGCLSIPDIRCEIDRPKEIVIKFKDTDMREHELEASALLARVLQHENDHLNGILFTDLIDQNLKKKLKKPLNLIKNRQLEVDYPVTADAEYRL